MPRPKSGNLTASKPTRFDAEDDAAMVALSDTTGIPYTDIVRRCVRLGLNELAARGNDMNWFLSLTNAPLQAKSVRYSEHPPIAPGLLSETKRKTGT